MPAVGQPGGETSFCPPAITRRRAIGCCAAILSCEGPVVRHEPGEVLTILRSSLSMGRGAGHSREQNTPPRQPVVSKSVSYEPTDEELEEREAAFDECVRFSEHDYDPRWDYEINYGQLDHELVVLAQGRMDELSQRDDTPFERGHVFPADLSGVSRDGSGVAAIYAMGTYNEPVVLIDLDPHNADDVISPHAEIVHSIDHEVAPRDPRV
jgi:hypothetical protein